MLNTGHEYSKEIVKNLAQGYMQNLYGRGLQKAPYYDISIKILAVVQFILLLMIYCCSVRHMRTANY